ncbi:MAG: hypothetical protein GX800_11950 [Clostridiaceae bacterium]|nr:hypothetical protein [Clostridiaceae bacterium]
MWTKGTITVGKTTFKYWVKHYSEGSQYGIDEGRISKLTIKQGDITVYNYDRGLDIAPSSKEATEAYKAILNSFN